MKTMDGTNHRFAWLSEVNDAKYTHPKAQQCTIPLATTESAGLMSPADKQKISMISYNFVEVGRNNNINLQKNVDKYVDGIRLSIQFSEIAPALQPQTNKITRIDVNVSAQVSGEADYAADYVNPSYISATLYIAGYSVDSVRTSTSTRPQLSDALYCNRTIYLASANGTLRAYSDEELSQILNNSVEQNDLRIEVHVDHGYGGSIVVDRELSATLTGSCVIYAVL